MSDREAIIKYPEAYLVIGDVDKPYHRPECACDGCENWRKSKDRPTHKECREIISNKDIGANI